MQLEVINRTNARDARARIAARSAIHERSADRAKAVLHVVASRDGLFLAEAGELVFAAGVLEMRIFDDEVGSEHAEVDQFHVVSVGHVVYLAVILRQSVQWQMKVSTKPSPEVGTSICTAPQ